jgi:hypothetical protein
MNILSTLSTSITLAKRLQEISKNISEAEFHALLAELSDQLSTLKLEASSLKEQLRELKEENFELKNRKVNEDEELLQLAKLLANEKIVVPKYIENSDKEFSQDLFSIFVNIQKQLITGISNKKGEPKRTIWLHFEVCPKLKLYGVAEQEQLNCYQQFRMSDKGEKLLSAWYKKKINKS